MKNGTNFTERELDIMSVLWKEGSGTVAEVKDELDDGAGYTTVLKMLQILEGKGMVRHKREGRAYRYSPRSSPRTKPGVMRFAASWTRSSRDQPDWRWRSSCRTTG